MLYEDYYSVYSLLKQKREERRKIDDKIEELRGMIDIGSIVPKDVVGGTNLKQDKMLNYIIKKEHLENKKISINEIIEMIKKELKTKENELKTSNEIEDRIYYYRYVEHRKVHQFNKLIGYSVRQTYRYLEEINKNLFGEEI